MARHPLIKLEHVTVARGGNIVLHDLNLVIHPGESLAILGPNGCGKSTLLKTITCECYPIALPEMSVCIMGRERWDLTELKRRMAIVGAELPSWQTLTTTGFDTILTGFFSSSTLWPHLVVTPAMCSRAEDILEHIDGQALRDRNIGEMSAGQQRRILIGRALAGATGDVKVLLLDEPSNALDLAAQQDLREMLRNLIRNGITVILITHHIADILPEMQRVVLMRDGKIVADGSKYELLTSERLTALFGRGITLQERDGFYNAW